MTPVVRVVDLRIVQTRDGRVRVSVDGRRLFEADSASEALSFVAGGLVRVPSSEQLSALASAVVGATDPVQTVCVAEAARANETGSVEKAHVSSGLEGEKPTKTAHANETGSVAGKAVE